MGDTGEPERHRCTATIGRPRTRGRQGDLRRYAPILAIHPIWDLMDAGLDRPGPPGRTRDPGALVARPMQAAHGCQGARALTHPSPSTTAMDGEDDAIGHSARLAPPASCSDGLSR